MLAVLAVIVAIASVFMKLKREPSHAELLVPSATTSTAESPRREEADTDVESALRARSQEVIAAINAKDIEKFTLLVHPVQGVEFNYGLSLDGKFSRDEIKEKFASNEPIHWGLADGSGMPVDIPFIQFFKRYARNDYAKAPQSAFDKALRGGSTSENLFLPRYQGKHFMSYFFPSTSTYMNGEGVEVDEMSWEALNLVFDRAADGKWYLIGLQQDAWSI